jgi:hypothetical protein
MCARIIKPKTSELYGEYKDLNKLQIEFIKIETNPNNRLKKMNDQEIAEILGVDKKSIYNYRQNPEIRKAISEEVLAKGADDLPDMIYDLRDMAMGWGIHKDIPASVRFRAKELWLKVHNILKEVGKGDPEESRKKMTSIDKALMNIARNYKEDNGEVEE